MADIFISYRSLRRPAIHHLTEALENHGYTVWFDYALLSGSDFSPIIERELRSAKAVIVVWCSDSVTSKWVCREAALAERLGTFLPVLLENVDIPFQFAELDTEDLSTWNGDPLGHGLHSLLDQIALKVHRDPVANFRGLQKQSENWMRYGGLSFVNMPLDREIEKRIELDRSSNETITDKSLSPEEGIESKSQHKEKAQSSSNNQEHKSSTLSKDEIIELLVRKSQEMINRFSEKALELKMLVTKQKFSVQFMSGLYNKFGFISALIILVSLFLPVITFPLLGSYSLINAASGKLLFILIVLLATCFYRGERLIYTRYLTSFILVFILFKYYGFFSGRSQVDDLIGVFGDNSGSIFELTSWGALVNIGACIALFRAAFKKNYKEKEKII